MTKTHKKPLPVWQESLLLVVIALVLAVVIKTFFVQAFYIPSASMEPGLVDHDRILVQKVSYWGGRSPARGDIVVFSDPGGWLPADEIRTANNPVSKVLAGIGLYPTGGHLVKRVIGIGGDHVVCCDARGRITVNGKALNEKAYLPKGTQPSVDPFNVRVPAGDLWVMGDNRDHSGDSRYHRTDPGHGFVADDLVVGRVFARVWPLSRFELIHRPATFADIPDAR